MATGETSLPALPDGLLAEVEDVARAQGRGVSEVVTEALTKYVRDQRWERLHRSGRKRSAELGFKADDVQRFIAEDRTERQR